MDDHDSYSDFFVSPFLLLITNHVWPCSAGGAPAHSYRCGAISGMVSVRDHRDGEGDVRREAHAFNGTHDLLAVRRQAPDDDDVLELHWAISAFNRLTGSCCGSLRSGETMKGVFV